jgi:hypothetical protein
MGSYSGIKAGNGFHVVVEDIGGRGKDDIQRRGISQEVGNQQLYQRFGSLLLDGTDGLGKVFCSSILQIIASDRGDDHIA